jgi:hypothetical protein
MVGLILAAPIASAAVHISADLARARASASADAAEDAGAAEVRPEAPAVGT